MLEWIHENMSSILQATGAVTSGAAILALFPAQALGFLGLPRDRTLVALHGGAVSGRVRALAAFDLACVIVFGIYLMA